MCTVSADVMGGDWIVCINEGVIRKAIGELAVDCDYERF